MDFTLPVFVLLDRIVVSTENRARIVDAAEIAYREAGEVIFEEAVPREDVVGSRSRLQIFGGYECTSCHRPGKEPEPRLFSFNNPFGACPRCQGFGNTVDYDLNLVIPDKGLSLNDGAIDPWNRPKYRSLVYGDEEAGGGAGDSDGRAVAGDDRGGARDCAARQRHV